MYFLSWLSVLLYFLCYLFFLFHVIPPLHLIPLLAAHSVIFFLCLLLNAISIMSLHLLVCSSILYQCVVFVSYITYSVFFIVSYDITSVIWYHCCAYHFQPHTHHGVLLCYCCTDLVFPIARFRSRRITLP